MGNNKSTDRLSKSDLRPQDVKKCISIKRDPITGKFLGVPKEWASQLNVDLNHTVETSQLPEEVRTTQLPENNEQKVRQDFVFDQNAPLCFNGIDEEMSQQIYNSGVSKQEIFRDSQNFKSILQIYDGKELGINQNFKDMETADFLIENPADIYGFIEQFEKGSNCKLYKIIDRKLKKEYISKVFKMYDKFNCYQFKKELAQLIQLECPYIVQYIQTYLYSGCFFIIFEYMNLGSLNKFITQYNKLFTEQLIAYILWQIMLALKFLQFKGRRNKNISSRKILLNDKGEIKLMILDYQEQNTKNKYPHWIAPETIKSQTIEEKSDIWSLGIIAYELSEGQTPYQNLHPIKVMYNIVNSPVPDINSKRSDDFKNFVRLCLNKDIQKRAQLKDLIKSDFITLNKEVGKQQFFDLLKGKSSLKSLKKSKSLK